MTTLSPQRLEKAAEALRELEQGVSKLNGWDTLTEATKKKWCDKASVVVFGYLGNVDPWKEAENCVPTNWCDSFLTGPDAPRGPLDSPAVEKLLLGIIKRIREKAMLSAELTERDAG
jgi:hypothetical protein